eukprot:5572477-Prymnesium_polylepis.1
MRRGLPLGDRLVADVRPPSRAPLRAGTEGVRAPRMAVLAWQPPGGHEAARVGAAAALCVAAI